tara:strand:- start:211 stop:783 length:573 start_codon:yes stop_codon:yes gene_type:complete
MRFTRLEIPDVILCEPKVFSDKRGYFVETFKQDKLNDFLGFSIKFCQDNESKSSFGVLRGLHFQLPPFAQTKLIRVIDGTVLDVAVDIRNGSPTFRQHVAVKLSCENKKQLLVPRGFAHGYIVLSQKATFAYKVDNYYSPDHERGIAYDDESLNIEWKISQNLIQLSPKDKNYPAFSNKDFFKYSKNLYD